MANFTTFGMVALEDLYIRREADDELCARLGRFEYCYVLAPRQMGKSSMALRAAETLRERGVKAVRIDLQTLAGEDSALALWGLVARKLRSGLAESGVEVPLFAPTAADAAPGALFVDYVLESVLPRVTGLVLFFDEVDTLVSCRFNTDPFFASLRSLHGERPAGRFSVCLLGVTRVADLVLGEKTSPFNVAHAIALRDFRREEADAFRALLDPLFARPDRLLAEAHAWTNGHPYMLQNVLREAVERRKRDADPSQELDDLKAFVNGIVKGRFFGQAEDAVLGVVRRTFEGRSLAPENMDALNQYRVLLANKNVPVGQGPKLEVQEKLRITGLVAFVSEGDRTILSVRNRIFRQRYDAAWVAGLLDRPIYEAMAARWMQEDEDESFLLRGGALDAAELWMKGQENAVSGWTAEFVNASRRLATRGARRDARRWLQSFSVAVIALAVSAPLLAVGYQQRRDAVRQSLEAQVAALKAEKDANDASVAQFNKELAALRHERDNLDATVKQSSQKLIDLDAEHRSIEDQLRNSSTQQRRQLEGQLKDNENRAAAAREDLDRATSALDASRRRESNLATAVANLQNKNAGLQSDLDAARQAASGLSAQLEGLKVQVSQLSAKITDVQSRYATCSDDLARVKLDRDAALAAKEAANTARTQCQTRLDALTAAPGPR
jgi:predicted  nucleic acid-binding Zn-ribbon protein